MTLRVLHLASFIGNIGDNAMHDGAYRTRAEDMTLPLSYSRMEIREFIHWKTRHFDDTFLDEANRHDLVILGGDSLFQTWREDTASGTYIEAAADYLDDIRRPLCLYGLGVDATRGVSPLAMERCRSFLDSLFSRPDRVVSLRDDGSIDILRRHLGEAYTDRIAVIPDGGLFARPRSHEQPAIPADCRRFMVVNLAGDMGDLRFGSPTASSSSGGDEGPSAFCARMGSFLSELLREDPDLGCVFVPHIHWDLAVIAETLAAMDDRQRRTRVSIAPYLQGEAWSAGFDLYRRADLVIAMRFHGNLVPLGLAVPTLGIDTHHKVGGLYAALGLEDQCVSLSDPQAFGRLGELARTALGSGRSAFVSRQDKAVAVKRQALLQFHQMLDLWLPPFT